MITSHQNDLLSEYYSQVDSVLTDDERRAYEQYAFYEVYEVEVLGVEAEGGVCCPIIMLVGACFVLFCMPDPILEIECIGNFFNGCCVDCWNNSAGECCSCLSCDDGCKCCYTGKQEGGVITPDTDNNTCCCGCFQ